MDPLSNKSTSSKGYGDSDPNNSAIRGGDEIRVDEIRGSRGMAFGRGSKAAVFDIGGDLQAPFTYIDTNIVDHELNERRKIRIRQIPSPPAEYVSRDEVEEKLRHLILTESTEQRTIYVSGLPRSGVSTLVKKIAKEEEVEGRFLDGTLWGDLRTQSVEEILWNFILTFDQRWHRDTLASHYTFRETLSELLCEKNILILIDHASEIEQVCALLPNNCPGALMIVVSRGVVPGTIDSDCQVKVPEFTLSQSRRLFRKIWSCNQELLATADSVIDELAELQQFMPPDIKLAARDILENRISPQEYIDDFRRRMKKEGFYNQPFYTAFGPLHKRLPEEAKRIIPYIGLLGRRWNTDSLLAVTPYSRHEIEVGQRHLETFGLVDSVSSDHNWYATESIFRKFARTKLHERGGDEHVRATRRSAVVNHLNTFDRFVSDHRLYILNEFLQDETRRNQFIHALTEAIHEWLPGFADIRDAREQAKIVSSTSGLDLIQEIFEKIVLADPVFNRCWNEVFETETLKSLTHYLGKALQWAVEQEDWLLLQRFSKLGSRVVQFDLQAEQEDGIQVHFGVLRDSELNFKGESLQTDFRGTRITGVNWRHCSFEEAEWYGVELRNSRFEDIDLVLAELPGLVAYNCQFTNIDARRTDLRGARFIGCEFSGAQLQNARLDGLKEEYTNGLFDKKRTVGWS
jgi:hypothetical protein